MRNVLQGLRVDIVTYNLKHDFELFQAIFLRIVMTDIACLQRVRVSGNGILSQGRIFALVVTLILACLDVH